MYCFLERNSRLQFSNAGRILIALEPLLNWDDSLSKILFIFVAEGFLLHWLLFSGPI